jgi:putative membrane protein
MRWVHLTIIIVFAAATLIFALQNLKSVTVAFLGLSIGAPLAVVIFLVYLLGAVTGGSLFALLRRSYAASRGRVTVSS